MDYRQRAFEVFVCICLYLRKTDGEKVIQFLFWCHIRRLFYSSAFIVEIFCITAWNLPALPIISQRPRTVRELRVVRFHHCSAAMILKMGKLLTYRIGSMIELSYRFYDRFYDRTSIQLYQSWPPGLLCENPIKTYWILFRPLHDRTIWIAPFPFNLYLHKWTLRD